MDRRRAMKMMAGGVLAAGAVVEETTVGLGRKLLFGPDFEPVACEDPPAKEGDEITEFLEKVIENRESKKYRYTLHGIEFVSDTISEAELKPYVDGAVEKVGGPYWKPGCPFVVESGKMEGGKYGMPEGVSINITDLHRQVLVTVEIARMHELIHAIVGPDAEKWPAILGEFLANSASPEPEVTYDTAETNRPSVSVVDPNWVRSGKNWFLELRNGAMSKLSKSLSDDDRTKMCQAAIKKGKMEFAELPDFMKQFGLEHAMFQPGIEGRYKEAFQGGSSDGRRWLLLVAYESTKDDELPLSDTVHVVPQDTDGNRLSPPIVIDLQGIRMIDLNDMLQFAHAASAASIEIPEWGKTVQLKK